MVHRITTKIKSDDGILPSLREDMEDLPGLELRNK